MASAAEPRSLLQSQICRRALFMEVVTRRWHRCSGQRVVDGFPGGCEVPGLGEGASQSQILRRPPLAMSSLSLRTVSAVLVVQV